MKFKSRKQNGERWDLSLTSFALFPTKLPGNERICDGTGQTKPTPQAKPALAVKLMRGGGKTQAENAEERKSRRVLMPVG